MTHPTDLRTLAALLRDQAPKRSAKRQPELEGIPGPAMTKLADAIDGYAAALGLPATDASSTTIGREAELLTPITGSPSIAGHETAAKTQDSIDLTKYGFRAPWPTAFGAEDAGSDPEADEPLSPAELADAFAGLPGVQPQPDRLVGLGTSAGAAVTLHVAHTYAVTPAGPLTIDRPGAPASMIDVQPTNDDWLRMPTLVAGPGEPAADGHYAPGLPAEYSGKDEAGDEPAYRQHRSVTQLEGYSECSLRYRFKYVDKLPEVPAYWQIGGRAFHETARRFEIDRLTDERLMTPDNAAAEFRTYFDAELQRAIDETDVPRDQWKAASSGKEDAQWWFDKGPEMAAQYVTHALASDERPLMLANDTPALELRLTGSVGGVQTVAYLDHVSVNHAQRRVKIKDYKTGSRLPVDPAQLLTYRTLLDTLPAGAVPDGYEVWGEYWAARKGSVAGSKLLTTVGTTANARRFVAFDRAERAGVYLASPTSFCSTCPFKRQCPVMSDHRAASETKSDNLAFTA